MPQKNRQPFARSCSGAIGKYNVGFFAAFYTSQESTDNFLDFYLRSWASNLRNRTFSAPDCNEFATSALTQGHLEATHKQDASCRHYGPHAARRPHLDGARHSYRGAAAAANKGTSALYSDPQVRTLISAPPPPALTCAAWMCVRSRVLVVDCATSAALRERRGNQAAADAFVASHFPTAPPEILEQRVMMSIPNIYNPNFNGMESTPFFVPQPNKIVGFRCASRLPLPGCSSTSPRCVRRPRPISTPRGFVSSASLLNSQLQGRRDRRFGHLLNRLPGCAHRRPEPARSTQVPEERKGDDGLRGGRGPASLADPAA